MLIKLSLLRDELLDVTGQAAGTVRAVIRFNGVKTVAWLAALLLLIAGFYLAQSSNATYLAQGVRLKEARVEELRRENAQLRFDISAATSPKGIEERAKKLGLGPATRVVYTSVPLLEGDERMRVVSFAPRLDAPGTLVTSAPRATVWGQIRALFGLGEYSRAEARSK